MVIDELKSGWGPKNFHPTQPTNISNKHINTLGQRLRLAIARRGWSAAALEEDFVVELVLDDSIVGFNSGLLDRGGTVGGQFYKLGTASWMVTRRVSEDFRCVLAYASGYQYTQL